MPAMMPGRVSGRVTVRNTQSGLGAERSGRLLELAVDRLDRQADAPHHQRKAHDGAGECGTSPAEGKDDTEILVEQAADRPSAAEEDQENEAGNDGRQDQRQVDDAIEDRFAPEVAAGKQQRDGDAEGQARDHGDDRDAQAEHDRRPFVALRPKGIQDQSSPKNGRLAICEPSR